MKKASYKKDDLNKPVTMGMLLEYTDEFLLPRISDAITEVVTDVVSKSNAELKYELKEYSGG